MSSKTLIIAGIICFAFFTRVHANSILISCRTEESLVVTLFGTNPANPSKTEVVNIKVNGGELAMIGEQPVLDIITGKRVTFHNVTWQRAEIHYCNAKGKFDKREEAVSIKPDGTAVSSQRLKIRWMDRDKYQVIYIKHILD